MEIINQSPDTQDVEKGKTIAIISYLTWIGTLVAYLMNNSTRSQFASFHIRQAIGLGIFSMVNSLVIAKYYFMLSNVVWLFILVLWVIGFIGAIQGEEKKVPIFGDYFQEWFKSI